MKSTSSSTKVQLPNSLLNDEQYLLIGKIAVAATELELAVLGVAKRVSSIALTQDLAVFSMRKALLKEFRTGLKRLAETQQNPMEFLQWRKHLGRVETALDNRDAVIHGVVFPNEKKEAAFFQARKSRRVPASISHLEAVLAELLEVTGHTYAIGFTIDRNVSPQLLSELTINVEVNESGQA